MLRLALPVLEAGQPLADSCGSFPTRGFVSSLSLSKLVLLDLLDFVNLIQSGSSGKMETVEKMSPSDGPVGKTVEYFLDL